MTSIDPTIALYPKIGLRAFTEITSEARPNAGSKVRYILQGDQGTRTSAEENRWSSRDDPTARHQWRFHWDKTGTKTAIEDQEKCCSQQYREWKYAQNCSDEERPDGKWHTRHAYTLCTQVDSIDGWYFPTAKMQWRSHWKRATGVIPNPELGIAWGKALKGRINCPTTGCVILLQ